MSERFEIYIDIVYKRRYINTLPILFCLKWSNAERTNVDSTTGNWSLPLSDKLVGIQTNLNYVVQKCKQRSQRKCSHEYGNKSILDY